MPTQDSVQRHESRDIREESPTEPVAQNGQAAAVAVIETQSAAGDASISAPDSPGARGDDVGLPAMQPAAQCRDQQLN